MISQKIHFHLLDILKICTLFSIQIFHSLEFIFFVDIFSIQQTTFFELTHSFARLFTLGGQILVAIVYFLFGFKEKSRKGLIQIAAFALLGQLFLTLIFMEESFFGAIEWDIYSFIFVTNLLISLIPMKRRESLMLISTSLCALLIPVSFWQSLLPEGIFFDVLSGRYSAFHSASWAPLPWFFLSTLFLGFGALSKRHYSRVSRWSHLEFFFWIPILLLSIPWLGFYFNTPVGPHFYEFNFTQLPWIFWANFIPFVFWMRLSLLTTVQTRLHTFRSVRWTSQLMWNRRLGLTYLISVIYIGIGSNFTEEFEKTPYVLDLFFVALMPACELISRGLVELIERGKKLLS